MPEPIITGKINLISAVSLGENNLEWNVVFSFIDYEGLFTSTNIQVGDCLYLDTSAEYLGTITRYRILEISSIEGSNVFCKIVFFDNNLNVPDLSYAIGLDGSLSKPSRIELNTVISPGSQLLPDKFLAYPANYNFVEISFVYFGDNLESFPETGEINKLYISKDDNRLYRWNQNEYVELSPIEPQIFTTNSLVLSSNENNLNIGNQAVVRIISGEDNLTISGFSSGSDGEIKIIYNAGPNKFIVLNNSTDSQENNRILISRGENYEVGPNFGFSVLYDGLTGAWRLFN